ncbi:protein ABCI7, chloroplastic [Neltuma alba]|uniref:protein ABCI7, chloroplastic n=1 Tax=Neltuma alba TaxID=207710 RepID=UPI0010A4C83C|nr:protein ABCI7, chloroplastic-like [Prosopis alba]XP_028762446.1 protein ABCI7, chloroplastic-like [Prosopis alba]XP_028762447.1 protein ABCI7, chloroplastic-like [Prosopis alba]
MNAFALASPVSMSPSALSPPVYKPSVLLFSPSACTTCKIVGNRKTNSSVSVQSSLTSQAVTSDPFVLELAETLEDSVASSSSSAPRPLQKLREASSESLLSTPWPSRKDEPFRFTDLSFIRYSEIRPVSHLPGPSCLSAISVNTQFPYLGIVDGHIVKSMSNLFGLPEGVYVGSLSELTSASIMDRISEIVCGLNDGDLFWSINGIGAPDVTVVYVPEGCRVENPVHLAYFSFEASNEGSNAMHVSNPRVLVLVEKGGEIDIIEEFSAENANQCYWANSALEMVIREGGKVRHSYIQSQSLGAAHIKWTSVQQESSSTYELVEVSSGGKLGRHNLHIQQLGPNTVTELSTLHLSVDDQTQDLHSRLVLDHPRGYSRQLHKCIVTHSQGQAVFDGNIKVNRYAQQTDAGQLTRSLLLEPRATVNVKPNLQIVADDVKCSHGAAISDLEESQLFYFQARGVDTNTARKILVLAFGGEIINKLPYPSIRESVQRQIKQLLDPAPN